MSDVYCTVCGEPWDYYCLRPDSGDMLPWEIALFRAGAGCPHCKGQETETPWHPTEYKHIEYGDEDPTERLHAYADRDKRPAWIEPETTVLYTCACCGIEVVDQSKTAWPSDPKTVYRVPAGSKARTWYHTHGSADGDETDPEPAHTFDWGPVCPLCLESCHNCGKPIVPAGEFGDPYDEGCAFMLEAYGSVNGPYFCIDCYETACPDCDSLPEDCVCRECEQCGKTFQTRYVTDHAPLCPACEDEGEDTP